MGHSRGPVLIMIPWQMKLIYEFGAQKPGEQPDSSSQPARGVAAFPSAASVPDTPPSLARYRLPSPANPTVNSLGRRVWVLLCCVTEWKRFVGELGGCDRGERSCWTGTRSKERVCRMEGGRGAFYGSDKLLALAQLPMSLCWGSDTILLPSPY